MARSLAEQLNDAEKFLIEGKLKQALQITKKIEKNENISETDVIKCLILESEILIALNKSDDALILAEEILKKDQILGDIQKLDALLIKAEALMNLDRPDESLEILSKGEDIYKRHTTSPSNAITKRKANSLRIAGTIHSICRGFNLISRMQKA